MAKLSSGRPCRLAEEAEQATLDRIPFGAAAGVVGCAHAQAVAVAQDLLQGVLPSAGAAAVAAAAVSDDQQGGGPGVAGAALGAPPGFDAVDSEAGGVGGIADTDAAAVGLHVVDAVGHGAALGEGAEVVVEDFRCLALPSGPGVAEHADKFLLLGIDTDHGAVGMRLAQCGDALELGVAVGVPGGGKALAIDAQGEAVAAQQAPHGGGTDREPVGSQLGGQLGDGTAHPAQAAHGAVGGLAVEQRVQVRTQSGLSFAKGLRPPPGRRTRPGGSGPPVSSRRPLATVLGCRPSQAAARLSPP